MKLTVVMTYYNQDKMLRKQIDNWNSYSKDLRDEVNFILVDDCSMKNSTEDFDFSSCEFDLNVYRVTDDVYFNVPGAVNLGADKTQTEWFIKQDMDTIIPEETMSKLLELIESAPDKSIYKFYRTNGTSISNANKITPGQFMIRKDDFWSIGAWDEDFCEDYGMNDPAFFWRASQDNYVVHEGYDLHVTIDSDGESDIERDCFVNSELLEQKKSGKVDWSDDYIRFNWKQVEI
tara:strand:+ start:91 stop:789 length:699 start_codon:yes stop_codon:yes gene_type:complete